MFNHDKECYFELKDARLYYEFTGHKEKPVLLMLHGGFESIKNLKGISGHLSEEYSILGVDTRGHGKSSLGNTPLSYELLQNDIENLLVDLGIKNLSILGFSDGGIVGLRLAISGKFKVNKLIVIGTSWRNEDIDDSEDILRGITVANAKEIFHDNYMTYQKLNPDANFEKLTRSIVQMWIDKSDKRVSL